MSTFVVFPFGPALSGSPRSDRSGALASIRRGVIAIAAMLLVAGCNSNKAAEEDFLAENQQLRDELAAQNDRVSDLEENLRASEQLITDLRSQQGTATDPFSGIPGVQGSVSAGEITAMIEGDILFASGKATLRNEAKKTLNQVAQVLVSDYSGRTIRVSGHTDADPIRKSGFKSNYHLGFERAFAVRDYLISRGVPARSVYIASHGPDQSRGTKQESRRVEVSVVTNDS